MKKERKIIKTNEEKALKAAISFSGIYVDSLENSARNQGFDGETVTELLKDFNKKARAERTKTAKDFGFSILKYDRLTLKAKQILNSFYTGHSMGCRRSVLLKGKSLDGSRVWKTFTTYNTLTTYAKSCTWSPTYGDITLKLTRKELQELQNINGIWTIVNSDNSARWLTATGKKASYRVVWQNGFVAGNSHSTISLEAALAAELRSLAETVQAAAL